MSKTTFTTNLIVVTLLISLASIFTTQTARAAAIADVAELSDINFDYDPVYQLDIPATGVNWNTTPVTYGVDNSGSITEPFTRIAYYLELQPTVGPRQWVWASMDAFTADLTTIGVPNVASTAVRQLLVNNMTVESNVVGIATGSNLATGAIEFWPSNFAGASSGLIPNATAAFDFGDSAFSGASGYGSMQVHNYDLDGAGAGVLGQTLFSYNRWGSSAGTDLGIGNQPSGNPDWTFAQNGVAYTVRNLEIFVGRELQIPEPSTALMCLIALPACQIMRRRRRQRAAA